MDPFEQLNRDLRALRETPPEHEAFQQRLAGALEQSALEVERAKVLPFAGKRRLVALAAAAVFLAGGAAATDAVPRIVAYFSAPPAPAPTAPQPQRVKNLEAPSRASLPAREMNERPEAPRREPSLASPEAQPEAQRPLRRKRSRPAELSRPEATSRPEAMERPASPSELPPRPPTPERLRPTLERPIKAPAPGSEMSRDAPAPSPGEVRRPSPERVSPNRRPTPPGSAPGAEGGAPRPNAPPPPGGARPPRGAPPPPPRPGGGPLPPRPQ